jgi:hypothetical protein
MIKIVKVGQNLSCDPAWENGPRDVPSAHFMRRAWIERHVPAYMDDIEIGVRAGRGPSKLARAAAL